MLLFPNKGIQCACNAESQSWDTALAVEATTSMVVELCGTSPAESWFWPVGFGFFPLPVLDVIRIGKETILYGLLLGEKQ